MSLIPPRRRRRPRGFAVCVGLVTSALVGCESNVAQAPETTPVTAIELIRVFASGGSASCPVGSYVVGGGCVENGTCTTPRVKASYPSSTTAWTCSVGCDDAGTGGDGVPATFAICARTTPATALTASDQAAAMGAVRPMGASGR